MNETPFHGFIDLIAFDQELHQIELAINSLEQERKKQQLEEQRLEQELEQVKRLWINAKKAVDDVELQTKELEQKEQLKKKRIDSATNHREYQSLKAEIEALGVQQQNLEKELLAAWHVLEQTAKNYELKKSEHETRLADLKKAEQATTEQQQQLTLELNNKLKERPAKEKIVPIEWLEKYAVMRSRVVDPVVPVINGHCSSCVYKVSEQDMIMLGRNKLLQCKDCYRFLYLPSSIHKPTNS
jgi:predicted  nucleic acid-binding Zn-ribbon protein